MCLTLFSHCFGKIQSWYWLNQVTWCYLTLRVVHQSGFVDISICETINVPNTQRIVFNFPVKMMDIFRNLITPLYVSYNVCILSI